MHRTPKKRDSLRGRRKRRGVSLVEFVIVLPVLLALTLGAVDFGRFAIMHISITNAARGGGGRRQRELVYTGHFSCLGAEGARRDRR